jgi:hypothetical protein
MVLLTGVGNKARTPLEREHLGLGHIGREELLELSKKGELQGKHEDLQKDPFRTDQCETCLQAKMTRYPKAGEAPRLKGGTEGIGLDVDLAGPLDLSIGGPRYLFVGIERSRRSVLTVPADRVESRSVEGDSGEA